MPENLTKYICRKIISKMSENVQITCETVTIQNCMKHFPRNMQTIFEQFPKESIPNPPKKTNIS